MEAFRRNFGPYRAVFDAPVPGRSHERIIASAWGRVGNEIRPAVGSSLRTVRTNLRSFVNGSKESFLMTTQNDQAAERFGRVVGRAWRALMGSEKYVEQWLMRIGAPRRAVRVLIWSMRLLALIVVVHLSLMLAAVFATLLILALIASHSGLPYRDEQPKLRQGLLGFGLYDAHDMRVDPHDPRDELQP